MTGGRRAHSQDHPAGLPAFGQTQRPLSPRQLPSLLAKSTVGIAAVTPVVAICTTAPRWLSLLSILILSLTSMSVAIVAAVVPQDSNDRLRWWREWLHHRERMENKRIDCLATRDQKR